MIDLVNVICGIILKVFAMQENEEMTFMDAENRYPFVYNSFVTKDESVEETFLRQFTMINSMAAQRMCQTHSIIDLINATLPQLQHFFPQIPLHSLVIFGFLFVFFGLFLFFLFFVFFHFGMSCIDTKMRPYFHTQKKNK